MSAHPPVQPLRLFVIVLMPLDTFIRPVILIPDLYRLCFVCGIGESLEVHMI